MPKSCTLHGSKSSRNFKECLIKLPDGEFLIRTIEPGSAPDRYTLVSYLAGAPPIRDAHVAEASFVNAIKRAR